tara:strand:+ start:3159 stop:3419 length:261 start_codon:yes stop_codon:yes gene_type:complete
MNNTNQNETQSKNSILTKIKLIKEFGELNEWFDVDFIESLEIQFEDNGTLTDKQEKSIDNIINKCRIIKWFKKRNHEEHKDLRMIF